MKTPIRLISISLRNFLSYGNDITTINLEFTNPTLIVGRNLDSTTEGEIDSNGAGKTTIVNALAWCLYDTPISDIPQDALINFINKKNLEITVIFQKDGYFYKIVRFRKHKIFGGDGIRIYKSDKSDFTDHEMDKDKDIAHSSIAQANKQLVQIIGMPFEIFSRIVIYSAGSPSFFKLKTTSASNEPNQTDIMEELTGLTDLSKKADLLNDRMKINKKEIESLKRIQEELDNQKAQYETKINSIKSRIDHWESVKRTDIKNLQNKIENLSTVDYDYQKECLVEYANIQVSMTKNQSELSLNKVKRQNLAQSLNSSIKWVEDHDIKLEQINEKLKKFENIDFDTEEALLINIDESTTNVKVQRDLMFAESAIISNNSKKMSKNAQDLEHLQDNKCPYCLQQFKDVATKILELEADNGNLYTDNVKRESVVKKYVASIEALDDVIKQARLILYFKSMSELNNSRSSLHSLNKELEIVSSQINPYADINADALKLQISTMDREIDKLDSTNSKLMNNYNILKTELIYDNEATLLQDVHNLDTNRIDLSKLESSVNPHTETLADMSDMSFDDNNYKKIEALENTVQHQMLLHKLLTKKDSFVRKKLLSKSLIFLNEQLKKYLDRLGLPHKVTFVEDMTASISQFGNTLRFGNLSSGQQARVNIALAFSFRDVLQKRYGKISFCILDECLDTGLSTAGVQKAAKFIKSVAVTDKLSMFIISHKDEVINTFPNIMEIELEGGFSRILPCKIVDIKSAA
jgi:DNA repair exonuclease SbcCD ATPase subunit